MIEKQQLKERLVKESATGEPFIPSSVKKRPKNRQPAA
jgi:hypothetical protein